MTGYLFVGFVYVVGYACENWPTLVAIGIAVTVVAWP